MGNSFCKKPVEDEDDHEKVPEATAAAGEDGSGKATELKNESEESGVDQSATSAELGPYEGMIISHIIGPHGSVIKKIKEDSGCEVDINDGLVSISGDQTPKAVAMIEKIVEEAKHPDYVGSTGKRLRDEAQALYNEADETYKESQAAFDSGDKDKGHELLKKTKQLRVDAQAKDNEAARAIWDHRNHESKLKMDFHGLRVKEAMDRFEEELGNLLGEEKSDRVLEVIPGAGHHSKGGESNAKLKPATVKMLKSKSLEFTEHNAGSFYVNLDGISQEDFEAKCQELADAE